MKINIKSKHGFIGILFILLAAYSLYQARFLILGPRVSIVSHYDGKTVTDPLIILEGEAKNADWISLNGHQIFTDENGQWSEKLIVSRGTSIITVKATDRFNRETKKSLRIVLN